MTDHPLVTLLRAPHPDEELAALLIARDFHPAVDVDGVLAELDRLAEPLRARASSLHTPTERAEALAERCFAELGFHGNVAHYDDPENSFLDRVIARRTGIPITLAIVFIALGRRAGFAVDGIGFPGHFLVRVGGETGVLVDPFHDGRIIDADELEALGRKFLGPGVPISSAHLAVADTHAMVVRMLANLEGAFAKRRDHGRAMIAADRLVALTESPEHRRDRGRHAQAIGAYAIASEDFEAYLAARPRASDVGAVRALLDAARKRATRPTWN